MTVNLSVNQTSNLTS